MAKGSLKLGAVAVFGLGAGCASPLPPSAPAPAPLLTPPPLQARPVTPPKPRATARSATTPADTCGADKLKYLIGRPHTEIPPPLDPSRRQVLCSTCIVAPEQEPWRQTIIYSSATGLVTVVACG
jgi:hypothetical protein